MNRAGTFRKQLDESLIWAKISTRRRYLNKEAKSVISANPKRKLSASISRQKISSHIVILRYFMATLHCSLRAVLRLRYSLHCTHFTLFLYFGKIYARFTLFFALLRFSLYTALRPRCSLCSQFTQFLGKRGKSRMGLKCKEAQTKF